MALGYDGFMRVRSENWRRVLFANAVSGDDAQINLALSAFLFALDRYPDLDLPTRMRQLDALAAEAPPEVRESADAAKTLEALANYLYGEQGFNGSQDAYDSAKSYFLHYTLEHRTGLPINLSAVYLEVGWRLGLPLAGIGMPGHFILTYQQDEGEAPEDRFYCDPFHEGRILTATDCRKLLEEGLGPGMIFRPQYLAPISRRAILYRMLNNIKALYLQTSEPQLALWATDRMLLLQPWSAKDMRDRGLLHFATENYSRAVSDLISYLTITPEAPDAGVIREQLAVASLRAGLLN